MQIKKAEAEALVTAITEVDKIAKSKKTTPEVHQQNYILAVKVLRAVAKLLKV